MMATEFSVAFLQRKGLVSRSANVSSWPNPDVTSARW